MRGIEALTRSIAGGPTARIAAALMRLISATRRPGWMDDETAAVYFDTVQEAMHDFPIDVVEEACIAWRKHGKPGWPESRDFWPSEGELRGLCEKLFAPRAALKNKALLLLQHLEAEEEAAERARQPSPFAGDRGRAFKEGMRQRMTPARFAAYFHSAYLMFAAEDTIIVSSQGAQFVLSEEGSDLLAKYGMRIVYDPKPFVNVRRPTYDDDTAEERAEVAAKLHRLKDGIAKGANLQRLRDAGLI